MIAYPSKQKIYKFFHPDFEEDDKFLPDFPSVNLDDLTYCNDEKYRFLFDFSQINIFSWTGIQGYEHFDYYVYSYVLKRVHELMTVHYGKTFPEFRKGSYFKFKGRSMIPDFNRTIFYMRNILIIIGKESDNPDEEFDGFDLDDLFE